MNIGIMVKYGESVCMLQLYTMTTFATEKEYTQNIRTLMDDIKAAHPHEEAPHIPVLPEEFKANRMFEYKKERTDLYLGLEKENVVLCGFERGASPFFILGETGKGKTNAVKVLLNQMVGEKEVTIFDSKSLSLYRYSIQENIRYITEQRDFIAYMDILEAEVVKRELWLKNTLKEESGISPKELISRLAESYIIIDDIDDFPIQGLSLFDVEQIAELFKRACQVGISLIITGHTAKLKNADDMTKLAKSSTEGLLVSSQGYLAIMPVTPGQDKVNFGEGLRFHNGTYREILLPAAS